MSGDIYFDNVSVLIHCNGTNGSHVFTDSSSNALTVTTVSDPAVDTSNPKFGSGSMYCDSTSQQYVTVPIDVAGPLDLSVAEDFTIEFWTYPTGLLRQNHLLRWGDGASTGLYIQNVNGGNHYQAGMWLSGGSTTVPDDATSISAGSWVHVALVNHNGIFTLYVNGAGGDAQDHHLETFISPTGDTLKMGGTNMSFISNYAGNFDDFRVTKGVARYTGNFTPPTEEFADGGPPGPSISVQPTDQSVTAPAGATFSVTASASGGSLTYQWYRNSVLIGGATSSSYIKTPTSHATNDGDTYYVVVTDDNGSVESDHVTLTVAPSLDSWLLPYLNLFSGVYFPAALAAVLHGPRTSGHTEEEILAEIATEADGSAVWAKRREFNKLYVRKPYP